MTKGNILELAATAFARLLIVLLSVRTIGYKAEQQCGGESGSQTHDFQSLRVKRLRLHVSTRRLWCAAKDGQLRVSTLFSALMVPPACSCSCHKARTCNVVLASW